MKKFDFVAELMAHSFQDINNPAGYELALEAGCETARLRRDFTKVIETVWCGQQESSYHVEIFVNKKSNTCEAKFYNGTFMVKRKWYKVGRQAYNAIAAILRNFDLEI